MTKIVSTRAELAVLRGFCHKDKKIAGTLFANVDASYFYSQEAVEIYEAVMRHYSETGESPTYRLVVTDPEISEDARQFLRESTPAIDSVVAARKAARILNKYRQTRGLYNMAAHIGDQLKRGQINLSKLLEEVSSSMGQIQAKKTSADAFEHFGMNNNSTQGVRDLLYGDIKEDIIPTGYPEFDSESGGFVRGSLVTLGASSGGGKSLVAQDIGTNQAEMGYKVLGVPLEMSKREMRARLLAKLSGIDVTKILRGALSDNEKELILRKYKRWVRKVKAAGGRYTIFKPQEDMTIEEVMAATAAYHADVVYIDYISLLKGVDGEDSWRQLGAAARYAKINAESMNRVSVLLCQVSEEGKIRYARAISEHSTNSWIWTTKKEEREKEVGLIEIEQPKSRNSRSFRIRRAVRWGAMRTESVSAEMAGESGDVPDLSEGASRGAKKPKLKNFTSPDV